MTQLTTLPPPFELKATGLLIRGKPTLIEYEQACDALEWLQKATPIALGDLAIAMQRHYPDAYQRVAGKSELRSTTIENYASIMRAFPQSQRHDSLTISHYALLKTVEEGPKRTALLNVTVNRGLTTAALEAQLKMVRGHEERTYQNIDVRDFFDDETLERLEGLDTAHAMAICSALAKYLREIKKND